jgi:signal recognition particle receptor subunit alpha
MDFPCNLTRADGVQVGAALSMTFVTGQPIYFVGCGQVRDPLHLKFRLSLPQTYTDLRQLTVRNVVDALLGA